MLIFRFTTEDGCHWVNLSNIVYINSRRQELETLTGCTTLDDGDWANFRDFVKLHLNVDIKTGEWVPNITAPKVVAAYMYDPSNDCEVLRYVPLNKIDRFWRYRDNYLGVSVGNTNYGVHPDFVVIACDYFGVDFKELENDPNG